MSGAMVKVAGSENKAASSSKKNRSAEDFVAGEIFPSNGLRAADYFLPQNVFSSTARCLTFNWPRMECQPM